MIQISTHSIVFSSWINGYNLEDIELLCANDFSGSEKLFSAIQSLYKATEPITPQAVSKKSGVSLQEISLLIPHYQRALYEGAILELQSASLKRLIESGASPEKIGLAAQKFKYGKSPLEPPKSLFTLFADEMDRRKNTRIVRYGFSRLDKYTGGILPGQLIVISARPSCGKSAFALQVSMYVASQGYDVLFFSLEMSLSEILERMVCAGTIIPQIELKSGNLSPDSWQRYAVFGDKLSHLEKKLQLFTPKECGVITYEHICSEVQRRKPLLIVIDQISLLKCAGKFNSFFERYTYLTSNLKGLAMSEGIAILLVAQLNRSAEGKEDLTLAALKNSGSLEEDGDVVIMLSRNEKGTDLNLAKNRNGQTGPIPMRFDGPRYTFAERDTKPNRVCIGDRNEKEIS